MDKSALKNYVKLKGSVTVASLQKQFCLSYKEARAAVSELIEQGLLIYGSGLNFNYTGDTDEEAEELERRQAEAISKIQNGGENGIEKRLAYLEERRRELIRRMEEEMNVQEAEPADEEDPIDLTEYEEDEEEDELFAEYKKTILGDSFDDLDETLDDLDETDVFEEAEGYEGLSVEEAIEKKMSEFREPLGKLATVLSNIAAAKNAEETSYQSGVVAEKLLTMLKKMLVWQRNCRNIYLYALGVRFKTGTEVRFKLIQCNGEIFITDNRIAISDLSLKIGNTRAKHKIERFIKDKRIKFQNNEMRIKTNEGAALADFMYLYWAVESLL